MTWNEFKKHVDDKLAKLGEKGDVEIFYIEIDRPNDAVDEDGVGKFDSDVNVEVRGGQHLVITN